MTEATKPQLRGRNLAVSLTVNGAADSLSYHDTAFATSYLGKPGSGDHAADEDGAWYPPETDSWFIVDEVDVMAPMGTSVVCALGDSITDGTYSTLNGNDRWPDAVARRVHAAYGDKVSVVNEGITGNAVASVTVGPSAMDYLDRDGVNVSGPTSVIWLEGIDDLANNEDNPGPVIAGYKAIVNRLHQAGVVVIAATLTPSFRPSQDFTSSPLGTEFGPRYGGKAIDESREVSMLSSERPAYSIKSPRPRPRC